MAVPRGAACQGPGTNDNVLLQARRAWLAYANSCLWGHELWLRQCLQLELLTWHACALTLARYHAEQVPAAGSARHLPMLQPREHGGLPPTSMARSQSVASMARSQSVASMRSTVLSVSEVSEPLAASAVQ
jgi:hypothetical protein